MRLISLPNAIILFFAFGFQHLKAQELHPILASFSLTRSGDAVTANFGILGGASCLGVDLERSTDSTNFEIVAIIPGICGGTDQTEFYTITDESPVPNSLNHYRLNLGTEGKSGTVSIFYLILEQGLQVFPIPADYQIRVLLDNPLKQPFTLHIVEESGKISRSFENQSQDDFYFDVSWLSAGNYVLKISYVNGTELTHKFMVY
jgi:hypothetical protein